jgi:hypothetical protein
MQNKSVYQFVSKKSKKNLFIFSGINKVQSFGWKKMFAKEETCDPIFKLSRRKIMNSILLMWGEMVQIIS